MDRIEGRCPEQRPGSDSRGFLNKAMGVRGPSLDQGCIDRIQRLAKGPNSSYTALTLLKTNYPFEAGLCFEETAAGFYCYSAFALETPSLPFRLDLTDFPSIPDSGFLKIEHPETLGFSIIPNALSWLFVVDAERKTYMLLTEASGISLSPGSPSMVISRTRACFLNHDRAVPFSAENLEKGLQQAIDRHTRDGKLHILILETQISQELLSRAKAIADNLGTPLQLPLNRLLLILEPTVDHELFAHRILKSLSTLQEIKILHSARDIEANSAFQLLKNYL